MRLVIAAYDLTNLAALKGWSALVTAADLVWGSGVDCDRLGGRLEV